jgi:GTP-binding protein HflX
LKPTITTARKSERAILVCTTIPKSGASRSQKWKIHREHLEELELLTNTAGADVIAKFYQEKDRVDVAYFIGRGKAEEIARKAEDEKADLVIFENALSPTQIRNLEKIIKCKVIDKPALILDIFATHARTAEAKTQVELAQLQYMQARLTRAWTHLSKQAGGIGTRGPSGTKGPGETQIETDRRLISHRISVLKDKLRKIEAQRKIQRYQRDNFIRIALVGYTNAGKSTLLNTLTGSDVYVENKLFATLDTSTRLLTEIRGRKLPFTALISDTVGFIRNLPHDLIESFKSTLAEVTESDLLLHVVDLSSDYFHEQIITVDDTLKEIGCNHSNILMVFNKVDLIESEHRTALVNEMKIKYPGSVFISASAGINLNQLYDRIVAILESRLQKLELTLPLENSSYNLINRLHKYVEVLDVKYLSRNIKLKVRGSKLYIDKILNTEKFKNINKKEVV